MQLEIVPTFVAQLNGKIAANAYAIVDVDGDDESDFVFGSMGGVVAVFKVTPDRLVKWKECQIDGCVTSVCADTSTPNDMRIFVATAEGSCFVFQATESGDEFRPSAEFKVVLNLCEVLLYRGFLLFGTREGSVLVYASDKNALGGYRQLRSFELGHDIESFLVFPDHSQLNTGDRLLVRCNSGHIVEIQFDEDAEPTVVAWSGSNAHSHSTDGKDYLVPGFRIGAVSHMVCGSLTGQIQVVGPNSDIIWSYEVPEAVVGIDRLPISSSQDAVVVCTWSGGFVVIQDPENVAQFRMVLPAASMFCPDLASGSSASTERMLVGISTSGVVSIYRGLQPVLYHAMQRTTLRNAIDESEIEVKLTRDSVVREIMVRLQHTTAAKKPSIQDFVRIATSSRQFLP